MSAELLIANLLRVAAEDLAGAQLLGASGNRNAIYLCQQAAEKLIRAVLTSEGLGGGVRHQLDDMVSVVPDANPSRLTSAPSNTLPRTPPLTDTRQPPAA